MLVWRPLNAISGGAAALGASAGYLTRAGGRDGRRARVPPSIASKARARFARNIYRPRFEPIGSFKLLEKPGSATLELCAHAHNMLTLTLKLLGLAGQRTRVARRGE